MTSRSPTRVKPRSPRSLPPRCSGCSFDACIANGPGPLDTTGVRRRSPRRDAGEETTRMMIHDPIRGPDPGRRDSPIFVPAVKEPVVLRRRGARRRRRTKVLYLLTVVFVLAAFAYAFFENARAKSPLRKPTTPFTPK